MNRATKGTGKRAERGNEIIKGFAQKASKGEKKIVAKTSGTTRLPRESSIGQEGGNLWGLGRGFLRSGSCDKGEEAFRCVVRSVSGAVAKGS